MRLQRSAPQSLVIPPDIPHHGFGYGTLLTNQLRRHQLLANHLNRLLAALLADVTRTRQTLLQTRELHANLASSLGRRLRSTFAGRCKNE